MRVQHHNNASHTYTEFVILPSFAHCSGAKVPLAKHGEIFICEDGSCPGLHARQTT